MGNVYRDETCAVDSSEEDEAGEKRPEGLRSRIKFAMTLQMSGVSRKGHHTVRS